ncbi:MAG: TonB-dependent receptor, partial [Roseinatronobacter sp.]|nr:TonB-dependent receptor [Roseinatronobacter sp.]
PFQPNQAADFLTPPTNPALRRRGGANTPGAGGFGSVILAQRFGENVEMLAALTHRSEGDYRAGDGSRITGSGMSGTSGLVKGTYRFGTDNEQTLSLSLTRWLSDEDNANYSSVSNLLTSFGTVDRKAQDDTATLIWTNPASGNPLLDSRVQLTYSRTLIDQNNARNPGGLNSAIFNDARYHYTTLGLRAENRMQFQGAGWENYLTLGIAASDQKRRAQHTGGTFTFHPEGSERKYGLFLQNEFIWNEQFTAVLGLRRDRIRVTPTRDLAFAQARSNTAGVASLALHYKINEAWAVFGSFAQTERAPTIDEVFDVGTAAAGVARTFSLDLQPERARTVEAGFSFGSSDLFTQGDSLDLKVTAFSNRITNKIDRRDRLIAGSTYENIARAHIRGIELEGGYDAQTLFGKFAYSRILGTDTATGARLSSTPADELVLELGARAFDETLDYGWRGTFLRKASLASGEVFPAYEVNDLFVTWRPDQGAMAGLEVQLAVNNVFDKSYRNILNGASANNELRRGRDFRLSVGRQFNW